MRRRRIVEPLARGWCNRGMDRRFWKRSRTVVAVVAASLVVVACSENSASIVPAQAAPSSVSQCNATRVHYSPYKGADTGLAPIPWIAASPTSTALVGHLFYYDGLNVWTQKRLPGLRIYSGGQSPDGRISMKVLWELRRGGAMVLRVQGTRLDGSGTFSERLPSTGATQFPSIINVPTPGCWRLTLRAGRTKGYVSVLAVPGKKN